VVAALRVLKRGTESHPERLMGLRLGDGSMVEAFVRLQCPECGKDWEEEPTDLPGHRTNFTCQSCHATRRLAEFMRTERDLELVKQFE
jgi:hypothetical protein